MLRMIPQRICYSIAFLLIILGRPIAFGQLDVLSFLDADLVRDNSIQAVYAIDSESDTLFHVLFDIAGKPLHVEKREVDGWKKSSFSYHSVDQVLEKIEVKCGYDSLIQQFQYPSEGEEWISKKRRLYLWDTDKEEYTLKEDEEWIRKMIDGRILQEMYFSGGEAKEVTLYQYWAGYLIRKTNSVLQKEGPPKLIWELTYDYDLQQRPLQISKKWSSGRNKERSFQYFKGGEQIEEIVDGPLEDGITKRLVLHTWGADSLLQQSEIVDSMGIVRFMETERTYLDSVGHTQRIYRETSENGTIREEQEEYDRQGCLTLHKERVIGQAWEVTPLPGCPEYTFEDGLLVQIFWPPEDLNNFDIFLFYQKESPPESNE